MLLAALSGACSSLIGLGELQKADCVEDCSAARASASGGAVVTPQGGMMNVAGTAAGAVSNGGAAGSVMGGIPGAAGMAGGSSGMAGVQAGTDPGGAAGSGGEDPGGVCPGGPEPPLTWSEHWYEHNQKLTRVYYDDCVALYFDADMDLKNRDWLAKFLHDGWSYSLSTYGKMGNERIYAIAHQGRWQGGHSATFIEASHDNHAVIDMGADAWMDGNYDLPAHLLAFLVDTEGAHSKFGSPKSDAYGNEGFPLIYKYDLYLSLGLNDASAVALDDFNTQFNDQPNAKTYWFRDWFLPVWRAQGRAQVYANFFSLLQRYYPAGADMWMPTMSYGQYFHFMSGAAGTDLVPLAKKAFQWKPEFDDEVAAAKMEFPDIKY